jgi:hypothetical protein
MVGLVTSSRRVASMPSSTGIRISISTTSGLSRSASRVDGLLLSIAQMTSYGFIASLLFLLWAAVAGIVLAVRPTSAAPCERVERTVPVPV